MTYTEKRKAVEAFGKLLGEELWTNSFVAQLTEAQLDSVIYLAEDLILATTKKLEDENTIL